jgi:hypothetical protein
MELVKRADMRVIELSHGAIAYDSRDGSGGGSGGAALPAEGTAP